MQSNRQHYLEHQKKLSHLAHIQGLLSWDQETFMPVKAGLGRSEQIGYIAGLLYEMGIDKEYIACVEQLVAHTESLEPWQARSVTLAHKAITQSLRLDKAFVEQFETVKSRAQQVRFEARKTNNFQLFAPHLQEVITMSVQFAQAISPDNQPYDTLLDLYEEGATQQRYDTLLQPLQQPLTDLIHQAPKQSSLPDTTKRLNNEETKNLIHELSKTVGFDFDAGMIGEVHHPFMTTLGAYDYRINTRYDKPIDTISSLIHELGHGLYEQWQDEKIQYTNLHGATMGMHESQSRTLENIIGRSKGMSVYLHALSQKHGANYEGTPEQRYAVNNNVHPSLIRIEADEISYGLHILLRYELEKELISGRLAVNDLPRVWNEKMHAYLGVTPSTDTEGCLQDVHRSCGLFGYFPTYLLGNLYAGQFFATFETVHPQREQQIAVGDFSSYFNRHRAQVRTHGNAIKPHELIQQVTGKPLDASYFLRYLHKKFSK